jgi:hypothetical protein
MWKNYSEKQLKNVLPTNKFFSKSVFITQTIKSDAKLKNRLLGTVIGHFTEEEFAFFADNEPELTRRMTDLLVQRIVTASVGE